MISLLGLAFLLFLAGLEIEFDKLRGQVLRADGAGVRRSRSRSRSRSPSCSRRRGLIETPLLIAIILCATSLGVLIPVLKDAGEISSAVRPADRRGGDDRRLRRRHPALDLLLRRGRRRRDAAPDRRLVGCWRRSSCWSCAARERSSRASAQDLLRLQDTTAQIRVRGAMVLLVGFAAIADSLGLESILGAFIAGAILSLLDRDEQMTHPEFRRKLEAIGFGVFIPVFFVASGVKYDLDALLASAST